MNGPRSGFLIVRSFEHLYGAFPEPSAPGRALYSIPCEGVPAQAIAKQYRGMDRQALEAWTAEDLELGLFNIPTPTEREACLAMEDLERDGRSEDDFIFLLEDARFVHSLLKEPESWELIWAADVEAAPSEPPEGFLLGYEPTWFAGDHFSALCDCLCFPRWHGADEGGTLFRAHHDRLNRHALFNTRKEAEEFFTLYRSQEWAETGDLVIAEVRLPTGSDP